MFGTSMIYIAYGNVYIYAFITASILPLKVSLSCPDGKIKV